MAHESAIVDTWLATVLADATLAGLAPGGVHDTTAPQGTAHPYVVFAMTSGRDVRGVGPARIMVDFVYAVKVVGKTASYADVQAAANRIDALLHAASGTAAGGSVLACTRESPLKYPEEKNGIHYRHYGGLYRLYAQ